MFCPDCGKSNEEIAKFCAECGAEIRAAQEPDGGSETIIVPPAPPDVPQPTAVLSCGKCGAENIAGWLFCKSCGAPLTGINKTVVTPPTLYTPITPLEYNIPRVQASAGGNKTFILAGLLVAAAIAAATSSFFIFSHHESVAQPSPLGHTVATNVTSTQAQTSMRQQDTGAQAFMNEFDPLVQKNTALERQIVELATEINKVAPTGITPAMISSAADLERELKGIKSDAGSANPVPAGFSYSQNDFLELVDYNITRSDALYRGASAWSKNQPNYKDIFMEGQRAKEAYVILLSKFERGYAAAKAGS